MKREDQAPATVESPGRIRSLERQVSVFVLLLTLVLIGGAAWHRTEDQLAFLTVGTACLIMAWVVWRYRIVGYSSGVGVDPETGEKRATTVTRSPLPREVLTPLLLLAALVFLLGATVSEVESLLSGPAHVAVWVKDLYEIAADLLIWAVVIGGAVVALVVGVVRRDREQLALGGCLGALVVFAVAVNFFFYLIDEDAWRDIWNAYLAPLRIVFG
jgi:hypothetical protein